MLGKQVGSSREDQRGGDMGWERITKSQQIPRGRRTQRSTRWELEPDPGRWEASWLDDTRMRWGGRDPEDLTAGNRV